MFYILDDNGNPIPASTLAAGMWMESNPKKRIVARTYVSDKTYLSTVFIGIDHSFNGGKPVLFESMWFNGPNDGIQIRYCTWLEAILGHLQMLIEAGYEIIPHAIFLDDNEELSYPIEFYRE